MGKSSKFLKKTGSTEGPGIEPGPSMTLSLGTELGPGTGPDLSAGLDLGTGPLGRTVPI